MAILHDIYEYDESKWKGSTNGRTVQALNTQNGEYVCIKEYKDLRYEDNPLNNEFIAKNNAKSDEFMKRTPRIMSEVNRIAGDSGDLVVSTDFFREGNMIFKVSKWIDMEPWKPEEVHEHLTVRQIDDLMLRLVYALQALHDKNILHCDLKPENVFIVEEEGRYVGKLSDFDDSFFLDDIPPRDQVMSTIEYMSPELSWYKRVEEPLPEILKLGTASDLFAIGLIYHMYLTGELPAVDEKYDQQLWKAILAKDGHKLSDKLDAAHFVLLEKLFYPAPGGRISTCSELANEINMIRNARGAYTLKVMNGAEPLNNKTISIYADFAYKSDPATRYTSLAQLATTDSNGVVTLTGLPESVHLKLRRNKEYVDVRWDADRSFTFNLKQEAPRRYCIYVTCDGQPMVGQQLTLFRIKDGQWQEIAKTPTNERGRVVLSNLPAGQYGVSCSGAKRSIVWDENNVFAVRLRRYNLIVRRGNAPEANAPVNLSIISGGKTKSMPATTNAQGELRFVFPVSTAQWAVECRGVRKVFEWPENGRFTLDLPLESKVKLIMLTTMAGSTTPVGGIKCALYVKENGKPKQLAEGVTGADGRIAFGSFEPGEYYIAALSGPSGVTPNGGAFRRTAKVGVTKDKDPLWIRMEFVKKFVPDDPENIVLDKMLPPEASKDYNRVIRYRDGHVGLVRPNGSCKHLHSAGELGMYIHVGYVK